jgi:hypothetical protein
MSCNLPDYNGICRRRQFHELFHLDDNRNRGQAPGKGGRSASLPPVEATIVLMSRFVSA